MKNLPIFTTCILTFFGSATGCFQSKKSQTKVPGKYAEVYQVQGLQVKLLVQPNYVGIIPYSEDLFATCAKPSAKEHLQCEGQPLSLVNASGKEIINEKIDYIMANKQAIVYSYTRDSGNFLDKKMGFISFDGVFLSKPEYMLMTKSADDLLFFASLETCPADKTPEMNGLCKKVGLVNLKNRKIVKTDYEIPNYMGNGPYIVEKNGKYGVMDNTGKLVVPVEFKEVQECGDGLCGVVMEETTIFFDFEGKKQLTVNAVCKSFSDGLAPCKAAGKVGEASGKAWGFIDKTGKFVLPPTWERAGRFSSGLAPVALVKGTTGKALWGYIDRNGKEAVPFRYASATEFQNGMGTAFEEDAGLDDNDSPKCSYFNIRGKQIYSGSCGTFVDRGPSNVLGPVDSEDLQIDLETGGSLQASSFKAERVLPLTRELAIIEDSNGNQGVANYSGKLVLPVKYHTIAATSKIIAAGGGPAGAISFTLFTHDGKPLSNAAFKNVRCTLEAGQCVFKREGMVGFLDENGKEVCAGNADEAGTYLPGLLVYKQGGKTGLMDSSCKDLIPPIWDGMVLRENGLYSVKKDGKWGVISVTKRK